MARSGQVTVLMITHKFREVMAFADEVTVLRRGRLAGEGRVAELTPARLAEMMVGAGDPRGPRPAQNGWDPAPGGAPGHRRPRGRGRPGPSRWTTSPSRCARERSSASPASPATASASWSRSSPASACPPPGAVASTAALPRHAGRDPRHGAFSLPEEPLPQRLRARHDRRREHGLPRLRPAAARRRPVAPVGRPARPGGASGSPSSGEGPGPDAPMATLFGRQRAACRAGARAVRAMSTC